MLSNIASFSRSLPIKRRPRTKMVSALTLVVFQTLIVTQILILSFSYLLTKKHDRIDATPLVPNMMVTVDYESLSKSREAGETGVAAKVCMEKALSTSSTW